MTLLAGRPTAAGSSEPAAERWYASRWLIWTLALGVLLRVVLYVGRPALHLDEARVALNIGARSWLELAAPLDYDQTAPLLFLWGTKLVTAIGGVNELTLRAIPFLAALALLPLLYVTARRVSGERAAVLAVALAAVSPMLLLYSKQVKPYELDALLTLILLWLALDWFDQPLRDRPARRLALAGAAAVWASTPAVFVVLGITATAWWAPASRRPPRTRVLAVGGLSVLSFGVAYPLIYRPVASSEYMRWFWENSLLTAWEPGLAARAWQGTRELVWQIFVGGTTEAPVVAGAMNLVASGCAAALLVVALMGVRFIVERRSATPAALIAIPLGVSYLASLAGRYPVAGRVMAFAAPLLILCVAAGAGRLVEAFRGSRAASSLVYGCLLVLAIPLGVANILDVDGFGAMRAATREYERRSDSREPVYVFSAALPSWTFYTTDWKARDTSRLARMALLGRSDGPAFENARPLNRALRPGDGDDLVFPFRNTRELAGLPFGAPWRSGSGLSARLPDTNWTAVEAARLRAAAAPAVWVIGLQTRGMERFLLPASRMCAEYRRYGREVHLARLSGPEADGSCRVGRLLAAPGDGDYEVLRETVIP